MNAVELDHATIAIGGRTVLADVSLAIAAGEFVGVLGPNGAGKTTLMRALLGQLPVVAGSIRVLGRAVARANDDIGYMPQTRAAPVASRLTAREFLASSLNGRRFGLPILTRAGAAEIDRVIGLVAGHDLIGRPLAALSGGERQRLLVAQALIGSPRLLLLDEPLISLDPRQQQAVVALTRRLSRELGLTVLFSAHELNQVLPAIDRVLYLGNRQAALGRVDEVVTGPVMSRLYGAPISVVRAAGRIFVLSEGQDVEKVEHGHDHEHDHGHDDHGHGDHDHARV